jgi:selenocysteine lyase/cysteine desulfurase
MPEYLPERLEAGTMPAPLAAGLSEGMRWLLKTGVETIESHERCLASLFTEYLYDIKNTSVYGGDGPYCGGTVLFNVRGMTPATVGKLLDENDICVRTGLHCSPLAHRTIGTGENGAVRISFGYFNTVSDVRQLALTLDCIIK